MRHTQTRGESPRALSLNGGPRASKRFEILRVTRWFNPLSMSGAEGPHVHDEQSLPGCNRQLNLGCSSSISFKVRVDYIGSVQTDQLDDGIGPPNARAEFTRHDQYHRVMALA